MEQSILGLLTQLELYQSPSPCLTKLRYDYVQIYSETLLGRYAALLMDEELVLVRDEESALLETGVAAIVDEAESDSEEDSLA